MSEKDLNEFNIHFSQLWKEIEDMTFPKMGMWMRFNYLGNQIARALKEGYKDEDINWDYINEKLNQNRDEFDFNMYDTINNSQDFFDTRERCITASVLEELPWQKHSCKTCKKDFILSFGEVDFYKRKNLHLPKRCPECRKKKGGSMS